MKKSSIKYLCIFTIFLMGTGSCERHGEAFLVSNEECSSPSIENLTKFNVSKLDGIARDALENEGINVPTVAFKFGDVEQNFVIGANYIFLYNIQHRCLYKIVTFTFGTGSSGRGAISKSGGGGFTFRTDTERLKPLFSPNGKWVNKDSELIKLENKQELVNFLNKH